MEKVIAIVGPTAVGKTALSFHLARALHTELISCDAYQIYRTMDIGTAKPTREELRQYRHHLIDILDPAEPYSAARFGEMARLIVTALNEKGAIPVLVGGTGLYIQSFWKDFLLPVQPFVTKTGRWHDRKLLPWMNHLSWPIYNMPPSGNHQTGMNFGQYTAAGASCGSD